MTVILSEAYETVLDVRKGEITVQAEGKAKSGEFIRYSKISFSDNVENGIRRK